MDRLSIISLSLIHLGVLAYFTIFLVTIREIMVKTFIEKSIIDNLEYQQSLKRMRILGVRFDLKVIALFTAIPFLILSIFSLMLPAKAILLGYSGYTAIIGFFITLAVICNIYYYKTYHNYYDVFIFGLIEEDTKAVLKNMYDDYPVFTILITSLSISLIPIYLIYKLGQISVESNIWLNSFIFISVSIATFFMIRGAIFTKPLGRFHAQVSSLSAINKMVPNGIVAIQWAFQDRKRSINFETVSEAEGKSLLKIALGEENLYVKTAKNEWLENNRPNVVLAIMESWGTNALITDDPHNNDLLGSLRPYMDTEFVFRRFLSASSGTMASLASIYFHSPFQEITQSSVQNIKLKETPFQVYKKQGYKTVFISAGNMMWRNLANYLPLQGVDELYDQNDLIDRYPEAKNTLSYWGIADEFAFKLAQELLDTSNEPLFINILTITNHPPYKAPKTYMPNKVNPSVLNGKFGDSELERRNVLESFQYACNALGNFITNVKASDKKENTIIAATGDHHIRGIKYKFPEEIFMSQSVPFILSVPHNIQAQFDIDYSPIKLGSHKDIMPTLYSLSLSNVSYLNCGGENLLAQVTPTYFAYHPCVWADDLGVIDLTTPNFIKYEWDKQNNLLISNKELSHQEYKRIQAYQQLTLWQINYLIQGYRDGEKPPH